MREYNEAARTAMIGYHPTWPVPYIVPGGTALTNLRTVVEAGGMPGVATNAFWSWTFIQGAALEDHLRVPGQYLITCLFYACLFKRDPRGIAYLPSGVTSAQAAVLQQIAYDTATGYALSGWNR
jgi:hypothetical protein